MNASKVLIAAIVAATIVGTVGFVSAQTSDLQAPTSAAPASRTTSDPMADSKPADMSSPGYVVTPSDSTVSSGSAAASAESTTPAATGPMAAHPIEPPSKADRN